MPNTDRNLMLPGQCDIPFPVPALTRTYRVYLPLLDLAVTGGEVPIGPPYVAGTHVSFNALKVARLGRVADAFGGIPLNALETAEDARWGEPTLKPIMVLDPAGLIRAMSVQERGKPIPLAMDSEHVRELLRAGSTFAPRVGGGFVRLQLGAEAKMPFVHHVEDLPTFISSASAVLPNGRRRKFRLSQAMLSELASGRPVVSGTGTGAIVLLRPIGGNTPDPKDGDEDGSSTPPTRPPTTTGTGTAGTGTTTTTSTGGTDTSVPPPPPSHPTARPELALLLPFDQTWLLAGYERGRLASSISLIPQEEVTIDIFSWDRRKTSREDTTTFDSEANAEVQSVDRDTRDVFGELTKGGNVGWGLNGSYSGYGISVGGSVNNNATVNKIARDTLQHFHEETEKATSKVHSSRQLKITESKEEGRESRVTRKLRNSNLCHPVTFHYFELMARYGLTTGYVKSEAVFVLLVDNPLARPVYDVDYVRTYETLIRRSLLEPAVADGLEAARMLWSLSHSAPLICNDCPCPEDLAGTEGTTDFAQAVSAVKALGVAINSLLTSTSSFPWTAFFFSLVPLSPPIFAGVLPANLNLALRQALFVDELEGASPGLLTSLATMCAPFLGSGSVTASQLVAFNNQFATLDVAGIDAALAPDTDMQTRVKGHIESRVRAVYAGMSKNTVLNMMAGNATGNAFIDGLVIGWAQLTLTESSAAGAIKDAIIGSMALSPGFGSSESNGVAQLSKGVGTALAAWTRDSAKDQTAAAEARRAHQSTFASTFPAATVLVAQERFDALVRHLRVNADYYANALVTDMISRGQFPVPPELLPYAAFVALQPMAVVRGRLAYAIDLSASSEFTTAAALLEKVMEAIPSEQKTSEVVLPTPGFVVEPKLSCCSSCEEFVEESRTIELALKAAQADQAKWEASRRQKLLTQATPNLQSFEPAEPAFKVSVQQVAPAE